MNWLIRHRRLFFVMVSTGMLALLGLYIGWNIHDEREKITTSERQSNAYVLNLVHAQLLDQWHYLVTDLLSLANNDLVLGALTGQEGGCDPESGGQACREQSRLKAENYFRHYLQAKKIYHKLRVINVAGREVVNVREKNGVLITGKKAGRIQVATATAGEQLLQDQQHRYYFQQTIGLNAGEIYVSPFDLNMEFGKVELPMLPTIRLSTPLFADGQRIGILVLSYNGRYLLDALNRISKKHPGLQLLDENGYWLYRQDGQHLFDFAFDGQDHFKKWDGEAWPVLHYANEGGLESAQGLYFFKEFRPLDQGDPFLPQGVKSQQAINLEDYHWKIVIHIPAAVVAGWGMEPLQRLVPFAVVLGVVVFILLFLLNIWINRKSLEQHEHGREQQARQLFNDMQLLVRQDMPLAEKLHSYLSLFVQLPWLPFAESGIIALRHHQEGMPPQGVLWQRAGVVSASHGCMAVAANHCACHEQLFASHSEPGPLPVGEGVYCEYGNFRIPVGVRGRIDAVIALVLPADHARQPTLPQDEKGKLFIRNAAQILEEMLVHEQAMEQTLKFQRAVEQSPASVVITDVTGNIEYVNQKFVAVTGYSAGEVQGQNPRLLKSGKVDEAVYREMWRNLLAGQEWQGELCNQRKDGSLYWESVLISPIRNQAGHTTHYLAVKEEITQKKKELEERHHLERQLRQAQKMEALGHLTGGIAHDFNNILAAIKGFSELTLVRFAQDEKGKLHYYMRNILTATDRARDLIAQMMVFSRSSEQEVRRVSLSPLVKEVVKLMRATLPASISITMSMPTRDVAIQADPVQLHQTLMNLFVNARDAMSGKGRLDVRLWVEEQGTTGLCTSCHAAFYTREMVVIAVRDDGGGIPRDLHDKIFQPFFTTKGVGAGTGMGLSVIHGIVHGLHGHIVLQSEPGRGSEFLIYFQPCDHAPQEEKSLLDALSPGPALLQGRVLVVDDEAAILEFLKEMLEEEGLSVVTNISSVQALAWFAADPQRVDLVITDQTMPDMTGIEMVGRMKSYRPELGVILCTGFSRDITAQTAASKGIDHFLLKPVQLADLKQAVVALLKRSRGEG